MICQALKRRGLYVQPCQKCLHCRVNRKSEWVSRLLLESACHTVQTFITLTYSDEHLPDRDKWRGGSLHPPHLRDFLKRLRRRLDYQGRGRIRFFACGEYGERSHRAHYHAILFGQDVPQELVESCWPYGFVTARTADYGAMAYIAGYTLKKYRDKAMQDGRPRSFMRASNRPGIGVPAVRALAALVKEEHLEFGDAPRAWVREGKQRPLGRLVRQRLREALWPGRADAVRDASRAGSASAIWLAMALSQDEVDRMMVESEKAAQAAGRVLIELAGKELV